MKILILILVLIAFPLWAQEKDIKPIDEKPIEQFTEIQKTKEPACKVLLTSAISKQVADKKAFQLDVKDWKFVDDEETKEVRGIIHHHYSGDGADTLIIIDGVEVRGRTVNGIMTVWPK